jgi:hypothetical protein
MFLPLGWGLIAQSFLAGVRFDLMTSAYLMMPALLIWQIQILRSFYFWVLATLVTVLTLLDFAYLNFYADRFNSAVLTSELSRISLAEVLGDHRPAILFAFLFVIGYWRAKVQSLSGMSVSLKKRFLQTLTHALFLALLARGSLGAHHLDLRHSRFGDAFHEQIKTEILSINSLYAFDQALGDRR